MMFNATYQPLFHLRSNIGGGYFCCISNSYAIISHDNPYNILVASSSPSGGGA